LEEMEYIYEIETRNGTMAFESTYFDDITNATLIALLVIQKRNLVARATTYQDNTINIKNPTE